jgi:chromosome segregation ATPase
MADRTLTETAAAAESELASAEAAVDAAVERAEAAEETAAAVAAAALESERGHQLELLRTDHENWRTQCAERMTKIETGYSEIQGQLTSLSQQMTELSTRLPSAEPTIIAVTEKPAPTLENPEATRTETQVIQPGENPAPIAENPVAPEAPAVRKRFRLS